MLSLLLGPARKLKNLPPLIIRTGVLSSHPSPAWLLCCLPVPRSLPLITSLLFSWLLSCLPASHLPPLISTPPLIWHPSRARAPPCICLSLRPSPSSASASCDASASHCVPHLQLIVILLSTGALASAACTAITRPSLWWLIVMLLMQHYHCQTSIWECFIVWLYGNSFLNVFIVNCHQHFCCRCSVGQLTSSLTLWRKPPRKVSYKHTVGVPDQGQMLDVWGWHPDNVNPMVKIHRFTISSGRFKDSSFYPMGRNQIRKDIAG